ncbi:MAG TPA: TorF family putative porin [Thiobacillus sp.]|nr:TorF family putative porin [Thiobacillus sp.]
MKKLVHALVLTGLVGMPALAVAAEESPHELTANVGLVSDYRFRGYSQTNEGPAIQGGFDYAHSSGFYLGTWASNVDFAGSVEIDVYGGYTFSLNDDLSFDVGALYYAYPSHGTPAGEMDPNTLELYAGATWKWLNVKYSHSVTDTFGLAEKNSYYAEANASIPLPLDVSMDLHYGYSKYKGMAPGVDDDYQDWKIGFSKDVAGFTMGLAYVETDIDNDDLGDGTAVVSVSKSF